MGDSTPQGGYGPACLHYSAQLAIAAQQMNALNYSLLVENMTLHEKIRGLEYQEGGEEVDAPTSELDAQATPLTNEQGVQTDFLAEQEDQDLLPDDIFDMLSNLQLTLDKTAESQEQWVVKCRDLEDDNQFLVGDNEHLRDQLQTAIDDFETLAKPADGDVLNSALDQLEKVREELNQSNALNEAERAAAKKALQTLKESHEREREALQKEKDALQKKFSRQGAMDKEISAQRVQLVELKNSLDDMHVDLAKATNDSLIKQGEVEKLQEELGKSQGEVEKLQGGIQLLQAEIEAMRKRAADRLLSRVDGATLGAGDVDDLRGRLLTVTDENKEIRKQFEDITAKFKDAVSPDYFVSTMVDELLDVQKQNAVLRYNNGGLLFTTHSVQYYLNVSGRTWESHEAYKYALELQAQFDNFKAVNLARIQELQVELADAQKVISAFRGMMATKALQEAAALEHLVDLHLPFKKGGHRRSKKSAGFA